MYVLVLILVKYDQTLCFHKLIIQKTSASISSHPTMPDGSLDFAAEITINHLFSHFLYKCSASSHFCSLLEMYEFIF